MAISRIEDTELVNKTISELSDRPTDPKSAGGDGLTALQLKARYDALPKLVKDRLNKLIDALTGYDDAALLSGTMKVTVDTTTTPDTTKTLDAFVADVLTALGKRVVKKETGNDGKYVYTVTLDDGEATESQTPVSESATGSTIAVRNASGQMKVADGSASGDAVNKGQLDAVSSAASAKYTKPGTGIPKSDLADDVKTSLGKADSALQEHQDISGKVNVSDFEPIAALARGANQADSVASYSALVTKLSAMSKTDYNVGQTIYVETTDVPDVWVKAKGDSSASYTYTTDAAFVTALKAGTLQIGYFVLAPMETEKVDITGKVDKVTTGSKKQFYGVSASNTQEMTEATSSPTASTAMTRDANGRSEVEAGTGDKNAVNYGQMMSKLSDYAKHNGYYPTLRSGFADAIHTDREIEDADEACPPTVFGTVGGNAEVQSGLNKFTELRGHTIKWNQLCKDPTFASSSLWVADETTISNNKAVMTGTGSQSQNLHGHYVTNEFPLVYGHTYLLALKVTTTAATTNTNIRFHDGSAFSYQFSAALSVGTTYIKAIHKFVKTSTQNGIFYLYPNLVETGFPVGETMTLENLQIIDLTEIYGEGNEPSTGAEFVRDFPMPYYPYNAGTLLSSKSSSVDFVKRNQCPALDTFFNVLPNTEYEVSGITAGGYLQEFDGNKTLIKTSSEITSTTDITLTAQTVYAKIQATTYTDVLCYIKWETPNLPYVPYSKQTITLPNLELRSAGSVYDVLYQQGGGKRRVGSYTFTGNEGVYSYGGGYYFESSVFSQTPKLPTMNIVCPVLYATNAPSDVQTDSRAICFYGNGYIYIGTSPANLVGVTLYYELATETDITTTENPGWTEYAEIDNFGTVKFNQYPAQTTPVPQAYFVRYTVNLVEFLDTLFVHADGDANAVSVDIPAPPTSNGTYTLKVTVSSGTPTYSWVADT